MTDTRSSITTTSTTSTNRNRINAGAVNHNCLQFTKYIGANVDETNEQRNVILKAKEEALAPYHATLCKCSIRLHVCVKSISLVLEEEI